MSEYPPPTDPGEQIFNPVNWVIQESDGGLSQAQADARYLIKVDADTATSLETFASGIATGSVAGLSGNLQLGNANTNITLAGPLALSGNISVTGNLSVSGPTTFSNTILATANATFSSNLLANGPATFSNTVSITGLPTFSNGLTVSGNNLVCTSANSNVVATRMFSNNIVVGNTSYRVFIDSANVSGGNAFTLGSGGIGLGVRDAGFGNTSIWAEQFGVSWRNLILQADGGAVGIRTKTPAYSLDVGGVIRSSSNMLAQRIGLGSVPSDNPVALLDCRGNIRCNGSLDFGPSTSGSKPTGLILSTLSNQTDGSVNGALGNAVFNHMSIGNSWVFSTSNASDSNVFYLGHSNTNAQGPYFKMAIKSGNTGGMLINGNPSGEPVDWTDSLKVVGDANITGDVLAQAGFSNWSNQTPFRMQYGEVASTDSGTVTFPNAFSITPVVIVSHFRNSTLTATAYVTAKTASSFSYNIRNNGNNLATSDLQWWAVGV